MPTVDVRGLADLVQRVDPSQVPYFQRVRQDLRIEARAPRIPKVKVTDETATLTKTVLQQYGLSSLFDWAIGGLQQGWSAEEFDIRLRELPEFRSRFPAIHEREQEGLPPLSPEEYVDYERTAHQLGNLYGIPITQDIINRQLSQDVSADELNQRFQTAAAAVFQEPRETREELTRLFGVTEGQMALYWMEPERQHQELQRRFAAGQLAGAAVRAGFTGRLTQEQALRLVESGLQPQQALGAFGQLQEERELFQRMGRGEEEIGQEEQIDLLTGSADVSRRVERRRRRRQAQFEATGGFAPGRAGFATGRAETGREQR